MSDYKGFNVRPISPTTGLPEGSGVLEKPSYYQFGQDLQAYGQGPYGALMPGSMVAGLIGGAMTGPYNRQNAFLSEMRSAGLMPLGPQGQPRAERATATTGRLAGAVNLGNGLIGLPNGDVMDHTGTVVGGAWKGVVDRNGGAVGWGVGVSPNKGEYSHEGNNHPAPSGDSGGGGGDYSNEGRNRGGSE